MIDTRYAHSVPRLVARARRQEPEEIHADRVTLLRQAEECHEQAAALAGQQIEESRRLGLRAAYLATCAGALEAVGAWAAGNALAHEQVPPPDPAALKSPDPYRALDLYYRDGLEKALVLLDQAPHQEPPAGLRSHASHALPVTHLVAGSDEPLPPGRLYMFGATGDLVKNHAGRDALMELQQVFDPEKNRVVLLSGTPQPMDAYLQELEKGAADSSTMSHGQLKGIKKLVGGARGAMPLGRAGKAEDFEALRRELPDDQSAVFYGAIPNRFFKPFMQSLKDSGLMDVAGQRRIVLEKPFGTDPQDAADLAGTIEKNFRPGQVLLIDHFAGKPGVLNMLAARTDADLNEALSSQYVEHAEVCLDEKVLSHDRPYFREAGLLRDMVQNHAMTVLATATAALPAPEELTGASLRSARLEVLENLSVVEGSVHRAQFVGFNDPALKLPDSQAETFVSFDARLDTARWKGVPIHVRACKAAREKRYAVDFHLKTLPPGLAERLGVAPNQKAVLSFNVSPDSNVSLTLPSQGRSYIIGHDPRVLERPPYGRLLEDAVRGEEALFVDPREAMASWNRVYAPIAASAAPLGSYASGTPAAAVDVG